MLRTLLCPLIAALMLLPACRRPPTMEKGGFSLIYRIDFDHGEPGATPESMKQTAQKRLGDLARDVFVDVSDKDLVVRIPSSLGPDAVSFVRNSLAVRGRIEFREVDSTGWVKALEGRLPADVKLQDAMVTAKNADQLEPVRAKFQPEAARAGLELLPNVTDDQSAELLPLRPASLTNAVIQRASVQKGDNNEPYVALEFNREGTKLLSELTERLKHKRLAIVLDNRVMSAPVVTDRIRDGYARISFGAAERPENWQAAAEGFVLALKVGPFPAPLTLVKERIVQPADAARR